MLLAAALLWLSLQGEKPDLAKLAKTGTESLERLERSAASWTAVHTTEAGAQLIVQTLSSGSKRKTVVTIEAMGRSQELGRLIVRDGVWYASDEGGAGKYRPFEAPYLLPSMYLFLTRSDALFLTDAKALEGMSYEGTAGAVATWRAPSPEPVRRQFRALLQQLEAMRRSDPARFEGLAKRIEETREMLEKGFPLGVDLRSGLIVRMGSAKLSTRLTDFRWLDRADEREFAVDGRTWTDRSGDPTQGNVADLILLGHNGVWQPGAKTGDLDLCLVNAKTGEFRRVPFEGGVATPGCFSRDRRKVYVSGTTDEGILGLFEIDLQTGRNRRLAENLETAGFLMFPALSPDGKTLALLHAGIGTGLLEGRVTLVDVASGEGRYLGKPMDTAFLSWYPDGKAVSLVSRRFRGTDQPSEESVARMDLEGNLTVLRRGGHPAVLADGKSILFQDETDQLWKTCDLEGKNVRPLGDGLARCGFPTVAPDGKRLLVMRFRQGQAPEPLVVDLATFSRTPVPVSGGIWAMPAWR